MDGTKLKQVLKSYEEEIEGESYSPLEKTEGESKVIYNDISRTRFKEVDEEHMNVFRQLLYDCLVKMPNKYTQGMSEIASVIVTFYLKEKYIKYECIQEGIQEGLGDSQEGLGDSQEGLGDSQEGLGDSQEGLGDSQEGLGDSQEGLGDSQEDYKTSNIGNNTEGFITKEEEMHKYSSFMHSNSEEVALCCVVLANIFKRKFDPLVTEEFKMYKEYNKVFLEMMKERGVELTEMESHKYMGSIFTFFTRNVDSLTNTYKIFELILSYPNSCPFLLLVAFYDSISKGVNIKRVEEDLYQTIIKLEEEFIMKKESMKKEVGFPMKNILIMGGVVGVILAIVLYKKNRED